MVYNSIWSKMFFYFFVAIFFPALTLVLLYWMIQIWIHSEPIQSFILLFWAIWSGYITYILLGLFTYIPSKVAYNKIVFVVYRKGKSHSYKWSEVSETKFYNFIGVLHILDKNGKPLYICHKLMNGFKGFEHLVHHRSNL
jgi:hypothetical protein